MKVDVETLFHELVDLSPQARAQYFVDHNVDEDTRRQVEALLRYDAGGKHVSGARDQRRRAAGSAEP